MNLPSNLYATQGQRFAHFIIDKIATYVIIFIVGIFLGLISYFTGDTVWIDWLNNISKINDILFTVFITLIYYFVFELAFGKTIGKMITGTLVLNEDGSKLTSEIALKRTLCRVIPFEQFSFIGGNNRGWHDTIPNTIVVKEKEYKFYIDKANSLDAIGQEIE